MYPWSCISCKDEHNYDLILCLNYNQLSHCIKNDVYRVNTVSIVLCSTSVDWLVAPLWGLLWVPESAHSRWISPVCEKHCTLKKSIAGIPNVELYFSGLTTNIELYFCVRMWTYPCFATSLATAWPTHSFRACKKGRQILTSENEAYIWTIKVWITVASCLTPRTMAAKVWLHVLTCVLCTGLFTHLFIQLANLLSCISTSPEQIAQQLEGYFKHLQNLEALQSTIPPGVAEVINMSVVCT